MPVDKQVLDRVEPEPLTEVEAQWKDKISPAELSLWITKLELICEEAKEVLIKTGISPAIQALDCAIGLYTASGDLCLGGVGTYLHVCSGFIPCKYILKHYKNERTVGVNDGDIFFTNEVLCGGFHPQDQINLVPIFWKGELIAWASAAAHEPETGATEPGGWVQYARTRYEEGLKATPMRVGENFELRLDLMDFFDNMVRDGSLIVNDMRARTAACLRLRQRVLEVVQEKGVGFTVGLMRRIVSDAGNAARERIASLNDGVYRGVRFFDDRGGGEGLGVVHIAIHKKKDELIFDLSGTSPATRSFMNAKPHVVRALLAGQMMMFLFADLPVSTGLLAPFKFVVPEGSVLDCPDDYAVGGSMRVAAPVVNSIMVALGKMLFSNEGYRDRACAPMGYNGGVVSGGGKDQYGRTLSWASAALVNAGGGPASPFKSGMDASEFWFSGFGDSVDVEHEELQYPLLYLFKRILMDGGGAGKYRGGSGTSAGWILHNTSSPVRYIYGTRPTRLPQDSGLAGGYGTHPLPWLTIDKADWQGLFQSAKEDIPYSYHELLDSQKIRKVVGYKSPEPLSNGQGVATASCGAPGYGDPLEANPEEVVGAVSKNVVSAWTASTVYKVAFDQERWEVDLAETEKLRERERAERKKRGQPFDKFEKGWLAQKPEEGIMSLYGPWPMGMENHVREAGTEGKKQA